MIFDVRLYEVYRLNKIRQTHYIQYEDAFCKMLDAKLKSHIAVEQHKLYWQQLHIVSSIILPPYMLK